MNMTDIILNYIDIRNELLSFMTNRTKNYLLSANKEFYKIKHITLFNSPISLQHRMRILKFFDNFTNVCVHYWNNVEPDKNILPKNIKKLTFGDEYADTNYSIPPTVTHVTFGKKFVNFNWELIPKTVTHVKIKNSLRITTIEIYKPANIISLEYDIDSV